MKLPLSWLREWVELPATPAELTALLTARGFEVESIAPVAPPFSGVRSARIVGVAPHPQADKLRVCQVDAGEGNPRQIVCGAPNARAGLVAALAIEGASLPGGVSIKRATLRGVESAGMLCSARELGLADPGEGLLELPEDSAIGQDLRALLELDDLVFEIAVTPNRGDAMSVLGLAREIAAATGKTLRAADGGANSSGGASSSGGAGAASWPVRLAPGVGCARFACTVIEGVDNRRTSPAWLRQRLARCGLRSISPVVDVTNLIVLELGQPMHAYDRAKLVQDIHTRRAASGEKLKLLDGREVTLQEDMLVIADGAGAVGLAGVMGGERTAISAGTRDVVLEVAWFDPAAIAGRGRRFGLTTDASQRFERGVDPALQERAMARAVRLVRELAGGHAGPTEVHQLAGEVPARKPVGLRARQLQRLLGVDVPAAKVERILTGLGLEVQSTADGWQARPPSWRFDLAIEADLIEEVARSIGLDSIPEQAPALASRIVGRGDSELPAATARQLLAARGFQEVITLGFVDAALQQQLLGAVESPVLRNPIASNLGTMRASLWPGLVGAALHNLRRQQSRCRLFEIATTFAADGKERASIAGIAVGARLPEQWGAGREGVDYFDLRADVEALLALAGPDSDCTFDNGQAAPPALHPGQCARVLRAGRPIGWIGSLHPSLARAFDLTYPVVLFELDLDAVLNGNAVRFAPLSNFPSIRRDLSFTVPETVRYSEIAARASVAAKGSLQELRLFDIYQGKGVESGRKSVALGLILQDLSRTLDDADADRVVAAVVDELGKSFGAALRE